MPASKVPEGIKACPAPVHLHITDSVDLRKQIYTSLQYWAPTVTLKKFQGWDKSRLATLSQGINIVLAGWFQVA